MTKTKNTKKLSLILCIVLIAAMALFTTGCNDNSSTVAGEVPETTKSSEVSGTTESSETTEATDNSGIKVLGEGKTEFLFNVTDASGNDTKFEIHTDETIVGEALMKLELISGEAGDYGLYVKEVNGIKADYDKNGTYWAFYINGEYAMTGVDSTEIVQGATYSFKVEK